jgi:3-oxoadipate CoA-transferase alpha subunit
MPSRPPGRLREEGMPINKLVHSVDEAVADIQDGCVLLVGGWGGIGVPHHLLAGIVRRGVRNLVLVSNNCGTGVEGDVGVLFRNHQVRKVYASFPTHPDARDFWKAFEHGEVEVELVPQGTLAERLRAAGAGLGGFFTPVGAETLHARGKETRLIGGRLHVLEEPLHGDVAIIRA